MAQEFIFTDDGVSGLTLGRSGLNLLLSAARISPSPFNCIVIDDTFRLSRNFGEILHIAELLNFLGVFLYFVTQKLDNRYHTALGQMLTMYGWPTAGFWPRFSHAVHRGMEGRILAGRSVGGSCFVYRGVTIEDPTRRGVQGRPRVLGYRYEVFEPEAEVVGRIFDWAGEGLCRTSLSDATPKHFWGRQRASIPILSGACPASRRF